MINGIGYKLLHLKEIKCKGNIKNNRFLIIIEQDYTQHPELFAGLP